MRTYFQQIIQPWIISRFLFLDYRICSELKNCNRLPYQYINIKKKQSSGNATIVKIKLLIVDRTENQQNVNNTIGVLTWSYVQIRFLYV